MREREREREREVLRRRNFKMEKISRKKYP